MTRTLPNNETDIHGDAWVARLRASRPLPPERCYTMLAFPGFDSRYSTPRQCVLARGHDGRCEP